MLSLGATCRFLGTEDPLTDSQLLNSHNQSSWNVANVEKLLFVLGTVLLLAIVGFLLTAAGMGGMMYGAQRLFQLADSGFTVWSIPIALAYGALISATDPVAVVSLLEEVGAPEKLRVVIEGESLLNDGAAILIFAFMENAIHHPPAEPWVRICLLRYRSVVRVFGLFILTPARI